MIYERRFLVPGPFSLALSIPAIDPTIGKAYSTDTDRINAMPVNFRGRQLSSEVSTPLFSLPAVQKINSTVEFELAAVY